MTDRTLVVAGNNCYASRSCCDRPASGTLSTFDWAMIEPFAMAWRLGDVHLLATDSPPPRERAYEPPAKVSIVLPRGLSSGPARLASMPLLLLRMMRQLKHGDFAYARLPSPGGAVMAMAALVRRAPLICSLHGYPAWSGRSRSWRGWLRPRTMYRLGARIALRRAILVFTTDPDLPSLYGVGPERSISYSGTLMREVPPLEYRPVASDRVTLGFVGRLFPEKNPGMLVEVAARLRDLGHAVQVQFVGDGPLRPLLERLAFENSIPIEFTGWVEDRGQLMGYIRRMDYLLLPSLSEGSPKVMVEAMGQGTPVATWAMNERVRSLAEEGATALLACDLSPDQWAAMLHGDMHAGEKREERVRRAHQLAQGHTVHALTAQIRNAFDSVVGGSA